MIIFFQEIVLQIFLWLLKLIDGVMEIFSAISGITDVSYRGERVNILEFILGDNTVTTIFWCVVILSVGLGCIFAIAGLVKNMIANNRNVSTIAGKFLLAILGTMAMLVVVILGILISNAVLKLVSEIFQIQNTTKLSKALFNACAGEWLNGYTVAEVDITDLTVNDIFGDYSTTFKVFPKSWKNNGMVKPDSFMYVPAMIASIGLVIALLIAVMNLAKRIYEIVYMYLVMPISMSTLPLDDGARFKAWREAFVSKVVIAYGSVFSVNVFILILPIISSMKIEGVSSFANSVFLIFMIVGGSMVIPAGQTMFVRLFGGADDMRASGGFLRSAYLGTRIATAMTIGAATKMLKGGYKLGKKVLHKKDTGDNKSGSGGENEKYSEEKPPSIDSGGEKS